MQPKNGDFAALLEEQATQTKPVQPVLTEDERIEEEIASAEMTPEEEAAAWDEVLKSLDENRAILAANPLTDEELEHQALEAGGDDDNPNTPE